MSYQVINRHNLHTLSLAIKSEIHSADFIAIDTEFSGLGDPKLIRHQNIETRYIESMELVKSHALLALGVSIFKKDCVSNYLFLLLSNKRHMIDPKSIAFLSQHGFDFNDQYENGIPYCPGNDDTKAVNQQSMNALLRDIVQLILKQKVVVHNGFLDLLFVYHSFYAQLPKSFPTFIADISDICKSGIYDTKYISDYKVREPASFLELLFKKAQRLNQDLQITIKKPKSYEKQICTTSLVDLGLRESSNRKKVESKSFYCEPYAVFYF